MPRVLERVAPALFLSTCLLLPFCLASCGGDTEPALAAAPRDILLEIDSAPVPDGIEPQVWADLKAALRKVVEAEGRTKVSTAAPTNPANRIDDFRIRFTFGHDDSDCYWSYLNRGD